MEATRPTNHRPPDSALKCSAFCSLKGISELTIWGSANRLCSDLYGTEWQNAGCQLSVPDGGSEPSWLNTPKVLGTGTDCLGGKLSQRLNGTEITE